MYIIIETNQPELEGFVYGPVETREEALELKARLAKSKAGYLKVRELHDMEELDGLNYVGNREIQ